MKRFFTNLLVLSGFVLSAFGADTLEVADLKPTWIYQSGGEWLPATSDKSLQSIGFFLDLRDQEDLFLLIESRDPIAIWLNGQLFYQSTTNWNVSFSEILELVGKEKVFITIISEKGLQQVSTRVMEIGQTDQENTVTLIKRKARGVRNGFVFSILILVFLLGIFRRSFPIKFDQILSWRPRLRKIDIDENYSGLVNLDNLVVIALSSATAAICWGYYRFYTGLDEVNQAEFLLLFFESFTISAIFFIGKSVLMNFSGRIFGFRGVSGIHTLEFLHFYFLLLLVMFAIVLLDFAFASTAHGLIRGGYRWILPASILFFQVWIYFRLNRIQPNTKILIFSYLCISEFLPAFMVLVWIVR